MAHHVLTFRRIHHDYALVRALITAPGSWDAATDDSVGAASEWSPNPDERIWYVTASSDADIIGLFTFIPQNVVTYEIHVTRAFGSRAVAAGIGVCAWFFAETDAARIVASIPATNRLAIRYARACGFEQYGRNPASFLKRGALVDLVLLGISAL